MPELSSEDELSEVKHEISARATVYHYSQYDDPDAIPQRDAGHRLSDYEQWNIAHVGYECACGERFIFPRTAAEHLRSAQESSK